MSLVGLRLVKPHAENAWDNVSFHRLFEARTHGCEIVMVRLYDRRCYLGQESRLVTWVRKSDRKPATFMEMTTSFDDLPSF